jgi:hypothetical protein
VGEAFTFALADPVWRWLTGDRCRAAARLVGFCAAVALGSGLGLSVVGSFVATAIRDPF